MPLSELYKLMKHKLKYMYDHQSEMITFDQIEFFALYRAVCDLMQIKRITDEQ